MIDSLPTCVCSDASLFRVLLRHGWRFRRRKSENRENDSRRDRKSQLTGSIFIVNGCYVRKVYFQTKPYHFLLNAIKYMEKETAIHGRII